MNLLDAVLLKEQVCATGYQLHGADSLSDTEKKLLLLLRVQPFHEITLACSVWYRGKGATLVTLFC